nr:GDSL esterase/lipase 1-like [Tanacetum cinerariifolium]
VIFVCLSCVYDPNRTKFKQSWYRYDFSRLKILDDGLIVGMIRIPGFYQPARSHNMSVEIDIFFECLYISSVLSGVKTNNFTVKVAGDIGVHLRPLQIRLPKIKAHFNANFAGFLQEMLNRFLLVSTSSYLRARTDQKQPRLALNSAEYARSPLIPPYLEPGNNEFTYGANFASAASGALNETFAGLVVDLQTQLQYFSDVANLYRQSLGDTKVEQLLSNAVYLFSCGANDYISHVPNSIGISIIYPTLTNEQYTELVIGNLTSVIKGIYEKGGRKFGFLTVPLIGCFPALRIGQPGNTCNQEMNDILDGFMYSKFDISTAITNRMNNPSKYGFNDGETACCGSGPFRGIFSCGGKRGIPDYELCDNGSHNQSFLVEAIKVYGTSLSCHQSLLEAITNLLGKILAKVGLDCDVAVNGRYLTSADEINSLQAVSNDIDCTNGKVASIAHELKGHILVRSNQDRSFSQLSFECLKGFNTLFGEMECGIFLEKSGHRLGYF